VKMYQSPKRKVKQKPHLNNIGTGRRRHVERWGKWTRCRGPGFHHRGIRGTVGGRRFGRRRPDGGGGHRLRGVRPFRNRVRRPEKLAGDLGISRGMIAAVPRPDPTQCEFFFRSPRFPVLILRNVNFFFHGKHLIQYERGKVQCAAGYRRSDISSFP